MQIVSIRQKVRCAVYADENTERFAAVQAPEASDISAAPPAMLAVECSPMLTSLSRTISPLPAFLSRLHHRHPAFPSRSKSGHLPLQLSHAR